MLHRVQQEKGQSLPRHCADNQNGYASTTSFPLEEGARDIAAANRVSLSCGYFYFLSRIKNLACWNWLRTKLTRLQTMALTCACVHLHSLNNNLCCLCIRTSMPLIVFDYRTDLYNVFAACCLEGKRTSLLQNQKLRGKAS